MSTAKNILSDALNIARYEGNDDAVVIKITFSDYAPSVSCLSYEYDTWGTMGALFKTIRERSTPAGNSQYVFYDKLHNTYELYLDPETNSDLYECEDEYIENCGEYIELNAIIKQIGDAKV